VVLDQHGPRGAGVTPFGALGRESGTGYRACAIGRRSSASRRLPGALMTAPRVTSRDALTGGSGQPGRSTAPSTRRRAQWPGRVEGDFRPVDDPGPQRLRAVSL
jgi:hypothetical protein